MATHAILFMWRPPLGADGGAFDAALPAEEEAAVDAPPAPPAAAGFEAEGRINKA